MCGRLLPGGRDSSPDGPRVRRARRSERCRRVVVSRRRSRSRLFPKMDAIGQSSTSGGQEVEIIGVVGDVAIDNEGRARPRTSITRIASSPAAEWALDAGRRRERPRRAPAGSDSPRNPRALDPQLVMYPSRMPLDDVVGAARHSASSRSAYSLAFAAVAIGSRRSDCSACCPTACGYGTREFGIRMALGAEQGPFGGMVLRQGRGLRSPVWESASGSPARSSPKADGVGAVSA